MAFPRPAPPQTRTAIRFLLGLAAGNLLWEMAHMPLYTLWLTGTWPAIAYAILHCTAGDVMIAATCLALALALFGRSGWPDHGFRAVALATILFALAYTVFSEWLNTGMRGAWAYRDLMPRLPPFGTGLTPVLQWLVVPAIAFRLAARRAPARRAPAPATPAPATPAPDSTPPVSP